MMDFQFQNPVLFNSTTLGSCNVGRTLYSRASQSKGFSEFCPSCGAHDYIERLVVVDWIFVIMTSAMEILTNVRRCVCGLWSEVFCAWKCVSELDKMGRCTIGAGALQAGPGLH